MSGRRGRGLGAPAPPSRPRRHRARLCALEALLSKREADRRARAPVRPGGAGDKRTGLRRRRTHAASRARASALRTARCRVSGAHRSLHRSMRESARGSSLSTRRSSLQQAASEWRPFTWPGAAFSAVDACASSGKTLLCTAPTNVLKNTSSIQIGKSTTVSSTAMMQSCGSRARVGVSPRDCARDCARPTHLGKLVQFGVAALRQRLQLLCRALEQMQQRDEEVADCEKLARAARGRLEQPRLVPASDLGHLDRCCHQRAGGPDGPNLL